MKIIDKIALVLIIIGAINWGLIGFFNLIFGNMDEEEKAILEEKIIKCYNKKGITFDDNTLYKNEKNKINIKPIFKESTDMPILEDLYNKFGIYWETDISKLENTDFPIMTDLYDLLKIHYDREINSARKENINILLSLVRQISEGADNTIFNGHTTIQRNSKLVCLDTGNIQNASENVKKAQYFNVLSWCWEQISKNRQEKVMLVADEAYLLIDKNCLQSIAFLRNVAKRCRKYERKFSNYFSFNN